VLYYLLLLSVLSLAAVPVCSTVGIILGVAMLVTPGATAPPASPIALTAWFWIAVGFGDALELVGASYWSYWMDCLHRAASSQIPRPACFVLSFSCLHPGQWRAGQQRQLPWFFPVDSWFGLL